MKMQEFTGYKYIDGGVCAAKGYKANGLNCGYNKDKNKNDLCLVVSDEIANTAGVYTQNKVKGAPVIVCKEHLETTNGKCKAIIANSKNANTCNADGYEKAKKMCSLAAGVVGVKEVPRKDVPKYCSLDVTHHEDNEKVMDVHNIIEKPTDDQIMSCYSILGRVVAPPQVFEYLEEDLANTPEGEELFFTDTLTRLGKEGNLLAVDFDGIRYDMGNKLGIMKANCEVALAHDEIGEDFKAYIKDLAAQL